MNTTYSFESTILVLLSAGLAMMLSSCSSATVSLDRRASSKDLADVFHATQGKQVVVVMLREPKQPRRTYIAVEFALDVDSARFIDTRTNTRASVPTAQIDYISCDSCSRSYTGTGVGIGLGTGLLFGAMIGTSVDAQNKLYADISSAMSLGRTRTEAPPSVVPSALLVGGLIGGGFGAIGGAVASQPSTTWILED